MGLRGAPSFGLFLLLFCHGATPAEDPLPSQPSSHNPSAQDWNLDGGVLGIEEEDFVSEFMNSATRSAIGWSDADRGLAQRVLGPLGPEERREAVQMLANAYNLLGIEQVRSMLRGLDTRSDTSSPAPPSSTTAPQPPGAPRVAASVGTEPEVARAGIPQGDGANAPETRTGGGSSNPSRGAPAPGESPGSSGSREAVANPAGERIETALIGSFSDAFPLFPRENASHTRADSSSASGESPSEKLPASATRSTPGGRSTYSKLLPAGVTAPSAQARDRESFTNDSVTPMGELSTGGAATLSVSISKAPPIPSDAKTAVDPASWKRREGDSAIVVGDAQRGLEKAEKPAKSTKLTQLLRPAERAMSLSVRKEISGAGGVMTQPPKSSKASGIAANGDLLIAELAAKWNSLLSRILGSRSKDRIKPTKTAPLLSGLSTPEFPRPLSSLVSIWKSLSDRLPHSAPLHLASLFPSAPNASIAISTLLLLLGWLAKRRRWKIGVPVFRREDRRR